MILPVIATDFGFLCDWHGNEMVALISCKSHSKTPPNRNLRSNDPKYIPPSSNIHCIIVLQHVYIYILQVSYMFFGWFRMPLPSQQCKCIRIIKCYSFITNCRIYKMFVIRCTVDQLGNGSEIFAKMWCSIKDLPSYLIFHAPINIRFTIQLCKANYILSSDQSGQSGIRWHTEIVQIEGGLWTGYVTWAQNQRHST